MDNVIQQGGDTPALEKRAFPAVSDLPDPFHGLNGRLHKVTVITNGNISPFLEINRRVLKKLVKG